MFRLPGVGSILASLAIFACLDAGPAQAQTVDSLTVELPTRVVKGRQGDLHDAEETGRLRLSREDLSRTTATQGDPMRAVTTLPGVNAQNDLSVRPFIRGGKAEETRVFLDGILLLQPYHFAGAYSPFNPELVEQLDVYRSGTPASMRDALSGAVSVKSIEPKGFGVSGDISMLRANAVATFPLPGKVIGYLGFHTFYYDHLYKAGLWGLDLFIDNDDFESYREDAESYLDLPNFRDYQAGLFWHPTPAWTLHWNTILSMDEFNQFQPQWKYYSGDKEVSPHYYDWATFYHDQDLSKRLGNDTLAGIGVDNQVHSLTAEWKTSPRLKFGGDLAWQIQNWRIDFLDNKMWTDSIDAQGVFQGGFYRGPSEYALALRRDVFHAGIKAEWSLGEKQVLTLGAQRDYWIETYDTHIPRPIYEVLVNGNGDLLESLGYVDKDEVLIRSSELPYFANDISPVDLADAIRFDYEGRRVPAYGSLFLSNRVDVHRDLRMEMGVRLEHAEVPNTWFPSPRLSFHQRLTPRDEWSGSLGLYAQNDLPFYALDANPELRPEKAWHATTSFTHVFGDKIKFTAEYWYKWYEDLVTARAVDIGSIDFKRAGLDTGSYQAMTPGEKQIINLVYGDKRLEYANEGRGEAQGLELSVNYRPTPNWTGWFSGEQSVSRRQDQRDQLWKPYRYHRPWAMHWVNWWHMPSRYALGTRLRYAAGQAYTPYSQQFEFDIENPVAGARNHDANDTLLWIGARNSARYAPYMRFDLRISHESMLWGHPCESYFEVWNAWNNPNFLLRDRDSGKFRFVDANFPIPILFMGFKWSY